MASSFVGNVNTITASATINSFDDVILVDSSSGAVIVTLPSAASVAEKMYTITGIDFTSAITIDPAGAELIDGLATKSISANTASLTIHSDGAQWWTTGGVSIEDNIYTADGSLTTNRILTGAGFNLTNTMTTGDFVVTGTTGSVNIDTASGATNSDILITAASGIVSTTTDGVDTVAVTQALNDYTVSHIGATHTSIVNVTESDITLTGGERIVLNGTVQSKVTVLTVDTTLVVGANSSIFANASAGAFTVTLPSSPEVGDTFRVAKDSTPSNNVTIAGNGNNIKGATSHVLNTPYEAVVLEYNGTFWAAYGV